MSWENIIKRRKELGTLEHGVQEDNYRCQLCGYKSDNEEKLQ